MEFCQSAFAPLMVTSLIRIKLESGVADMFRGTCGILGLRVLTPYYECLETDVTKC
jgi:hypothetical protein